MLPAILTDLDLDATRDSGSLFVDLVARHLEETRAGTGPVSTALSAKEIAQRFTSRCRARGSRYARSWSAWAVCSRRADATA
jgi:hypothetical protein